MPRSLSTLSLSRNCGEEDAGTVPVIYIDYQLPECPTSKMVYYAPEVDGLQELISHDQYAQ